MDKEPVPRTAGSVRHCTRVGTALLAVLPLRCLARRHRFAARFRAARLLFQHPQAVCRWSPSTSAVVRSCCWVDRDVVELKLPIRTAGTRSCSRAARSACCRLVCCRAFWLSFLLLLVLFSAATLAYVNAAQPPGPEREARADPATTSRPGRIAISKLKIRRRRQGRRAELPIRFIGKSSTGRDEDDAAHQPAPRSRGLQGGP